MRKIKWSLHNCCTVFQNILEWFSVRKSVKRLISLMEFRVATSFWDHSKLGPNTMDRFVADILLTSWCSTTYKNEGKQDGKLQVIILKIHSRAGKIEVLHTNNFCAANF